MTDVKALLSKEVQLLEDAIRVFEWSFRICSGIGIKDIFSMNELTEFEALTARFSRLSDILIQKVFRAIDEFELVEPGSIRDRINRSEKRGLIADTEHLVKIRILRNEITHEYLPEELKDIFREVMKYARVLLDSSKKTVDYSKTLLEP
jgi:hypothetical protein